MPDHVFMYLRRYEGHTWAVTANFSREETTLELPEMGPYGDLIIGNYGRESVDFKRLQLRPFEAFAVKLL
ncbi:Oligo-1,6-glucosidase [compost metagenome]